MRALERWLDAAGITQGPLFRRIWAMPRPQNPPANWTPIHVVGHNAIDARTVARIVQARGAAVGFDPHALGGHSLKRGAMNTAKDRRVHPTQLKQLGRHKSYATLSAYIEEGDLFEDTRLTACFNPGSALIIRHRRRALSIVLKSSETTALITLTNPLLLPYRPEKTCILGWALAKSDRSLEFRECTVSRYRDFRLSRFLYFRVSVLRGFGVSEITDSRITRFPVSGGRGRLFVGGSQTWPRVLTLCVLP